MGSTALFGTFFLAILAAFRPMDRGEVLIVRFRRLLELNLCKTPVVIHARLARFAFVEYMSFIGAIGAVGRWFEDHFLFLKPRQTKTCFDRVKPSLPHARTVGETIRCF